MSMSTPRNYPVSHGWERLTTTREEEVIIRLEVTAEVTASVTLKVIH